MSFHQVGDTPLMKSSQRGFSVIVEHLLQHNADPNIPNNVSTCHVHNVECGTQCFTYMTLYSVYRLPQHSRGSTMMLWQVSRTVHRVGEQRWWQQRPKDTKTWFKHCSNMEQMFWLSWTRYMYFLLYCCVETVYKAEYCYMHFYCPVSFLCSGTLESIVANM